MSFAAFWDLPGRKYFWTFTWPSVMNDVCYGLSWATFLRALRKRMSSEACGLSVWERHPGGHGLHRHMVVNERVSVDMVRRLARWAGIGRIDARVCDERTGVYMGKYLSKEERVFGLRKWGKFGDWSHVPVAELVFESPAVGRFRSIYAELKMRGYEHTGAWALARKIELAPVSFGREMGIDKEGICQPF